MDGCTLGDYGIRKESTVSVSVRLPGGMSRRVQYKCDTCKMFFTNLKAHKHDPNSAAEVPKPEDPPQEDQPPGPLQGQLLYTDAKKMIKRFRKRLNQ